MGRPIAPKMSGISTMDYHTADPIVQMQLSGDMAANREAQRKATHNEVECCVECCWRRDRINELIKILAQIVPACQKKDATILVPLSGMCTARERYWTRQWTT
ncbi:uncharacterized protein LOC135352141 isoform X2 [Halichondria panicea]|uniref:uncharacterized protein LOC135352141 isoform X2 n=1 Tax=Halichondria panicea TaxID=6063 RepID=UPI00312B2D46